MYTYKSHYHKMSLSTRCNKNKVPTSTTNIYPIGK